VGLTNEQKREVRAVKRLVLSDTDRKIAGLCGGLGEMLDIDPTLIRLALVFLGLATGIVPMAIAYVIAWIIVPRRSGGADRPTPPVS
jgi:phage shock protein PspC (stress-responsive transcriptional regulator)